MFEDQCLVCGKILDDDGCVVLSALSAAGPSPQHSRAYCSEDCQSQDISSPSISSASSAVSSPNFGYATGGEVPALALGSALNRYTRSRHHYSVSSSSASSWSALTDDEDDQYLGVSSYNTKPFHDSADSLYDGNSISANYFDTMKPSSALSYTRRPSGTNNHSTVPNPHARSTNSTHIHDIPRSAPLHSHLSIDDDGLSSDTGFSSRDESESDHHITKPATSQQKSKRNRASLPSYFSLLQVTGKRVSPVSSSSGKTIAARASPPTPKVPLADLTLTTMSPTTLRGRRRTTDSGCDARSFGESSSRSRSRTRRALLRFTPSCSLEADEEHALQFTSISGLTRGRPTVRRNSSPPPAIMLSAEALNNHNRALAAAAMRTDGALSPFPQETRGRVKGDVEVNAPGFGIGRSGLMHRERAPPSVRPTRAL
ncbi:hypothetical protein H0H87_005141 [Tephrocybe sp. NHM501043]|nr:hypothetical protein H0H87_005141 [Tephrocybe sp. NHM501043]